MADRKPTYKPSREEVEANPERYLVYGSGAVWDREQGTICTKFPGPYDITEATSQEMHRMRRELGLKAQLRGLAASEGIELPPEAEQELISQGAATALEALTRHMAEQFKASKNLRGMGEVYGKLSAPLIGESGSGAPTGGDPLQEAAAALVPLLVEYARRKHLLEGEILDGQVSAEAVQAQGIAKIK